MNIEWGPNWEDDLAGGHIAGLEDPNVQKMEESIKTEFDEVFMMYLPRICEHCINWRASHPVHRRHVQTRGGRHCACGSKRMPFMEILRLIVSL